MQSLKQGWKMIQFGDIAQSVADRVDPAEATTDVYVGLEHLDPRTIHLRHWGHPSDVTGQKLAFKKGDVIFGRRRAYQRKLAVAEFDGICSAHAMVVRAKPKMILPEFLPFFLQSDMFMERAIEISVGSLSPTINWKTLRIEEFPLPPLEEQKRIAEILWAVDVAIENFKRLREALSKTWHVQMSHFWKSAGDSELLNKTVEEVAAPIRNAIADGPFGSNLKTVHYRRSGIPVIQSGFVTSGKFEAEKYVYIEESHFLTQIRSKVVPGDIVMAKIGENCGTCAVLPMDHPESIIASNTLKITVNEDLCRTNYLLSLFHYLYRKNGMRLLKNETAQPAISLSALKRMKIPVVDIADQDFLLFKLTSIERNIEQAEGHISKLTQLLKAVINGTTMNGAAHV
ncbi:MAG: restriction endonuclease subunit S [Desulfobulbus sp.]|nr:restriction endonuclease subunit S [Desulfobulbus sp.]